MKIKILEILYVSVPILALLLVIALFIPLIRNRRFFWWIVLLCFTTSGAIWCYCLSAINQITSHMAAMEVNIHWGSTKSDVIEYMGSSPTLEFEPGYISEDEILQTSTIWHYHIKAFPLRAGVQLEFVENKLIAFGDSIPRSYLPSFFSPDPGS